MRKSWGFDTPLVEVILATESAASLKFQPNICGTELGTALRRADLLPTRIIGIKMADESSFVTFYMDDSTCQIGGKKHFILAAVSFESEDAVLSQWVQQKAKFSLPPYAEVRWNCRNLSIEQRREFIPIAGQSTVLVVLDDRSKQAAAMHVCEQAWRFCQESGISGFRLRFDENIVSDWKALKTHLDAFNPPCVGLCEADSRYEHLIQAADFVAGAMKLKIDLGLGERDPNEKIFLAPDMAEGYGLTVEEGCELGWFMFASLRYCIWGKTYAPPGNPEQPWKNTRGRGLIVHSSVDQEMVGKAVVNLDDFFMGRIH